MPWDWSSTKVFLFQHQQGRSNHHLFCP
ncbi:hypothetical protein NC653_024358 [Populus alba x Populus x berolinensis]|uniref:Uncharacterized protein n=1 Tax=Populus alba x Populus x berolinensis TaxID=444605 RepID=A0AAD6M954_9ROSI|nr:hypothetical protein NC653_024358 [Populus alba x Populus x berolinensis]